jgi:glutaminyl-tRNA synthetase
VEILRGCLLEPGLANTSSGERFQFVRHGYFIADAVDSRPASPVFNRIVELKDTYKGDRKAGSSAAGDRETKPARKPAAPKEKAPAAGTVSDERVRARANNPSLAMRHEDYIAKHGLSPEVADVLTGDPAVAGFFDAAVAAHPNAKVLANWVANDVLRELKGRSIDGLPFGPAEIAELVRLVDEGSVSTAAGRTVFEGMMAGGGKPREIARKLGLDQAVSASELSAAVAAALAAMPDKVEAYRAGKTSLLGLFTGQVMKATGGKADPKAVQELIRKKLG